MPEQYSYSSSVPPCLCHIYWDQCLNFDLVISFFGGPIMNFFLSCPRMLWWYAHLGDGQMKSTCSIFNCWKKHLWPNYMRANTVSRGCLISLQDTVGKWNHLGESLNMPNLIRYKAKATFPYSLAQKQNDIVLTYQIDVLYLYDVAGMSRDSWCWQSQVLHEGWAYGLTFLLRKSARWKNPFYQW